MSLQLTDAKKKAIATLIKNSHEMHLTRFPFAKYPTEPLEAWKTQFSKPEDVDALTLKAALSWSCGKWQQQSIPYPYRRLHLQIISKWKAFLEETESTMDYSSIISYWTDLLGQEEPAFNTVAFLAHLLCSDQVELVDFKRLKGMNDLLQEAELTGDFSNFEDVQAALKQYTEFYRQLLPKLESYWGERSSETFSRFLFAYGYRDVLEKVAEKHPPLPKPLITALDWDSTISHNFKLDSITEKANADRLFACLLLALDLQKKSSDPLTISEVLKLIPLGTGGVCNPGSYNYAFIAMFGKQKERDYFVFDNPAIANDFTNQANQSTRDMNFYKKHLDTIVKVNPKYIKA